MLVRYRGKNSLKLLLWFLFLQQALALKTTVAGVNEFYKKGCQEKSSPSTGGREDFCVSRSSPLTVSAPRFRLSGFALACLPFLWVSSFGGDDADQSQNLASDLVLGMSTMVLSEARGLSLFLVIRGGITCNG